MLVGLGRLVESRGTPSGAEPHGANAPISGPANKISLAQHIATQGFLNAPRRTRTYDPLIKSQLLCQLS